MSELHPQTTPATFATDAPERVITITTGYMFRPGHPDIPDAGKDRRTAILRPAIVKETTGLSAYPNNSAACQNAIMLSNGATVRIDEDGSQLTYKTPEVLGNENAGIEDFAGISIMQRLTRQEAGRKPYLGGLSRSSGSFAAGRSITSTTSLELTIPKDTVDLNGRSVEHVKSAIAAFLLLGGNGMAGKDGYEFSQKARGFGNTFSGSSLVEGSKPLGSITFGEQWNTLVLRGFDAGSIEQQVLVSGVMSVFLRMLEHSKRDESILKDLPILISPTSAMRAFSCDTIFTETTEVVTGKTYTSIDLLEQYLAAIDNFQTDLRQYKGVLLPDSEQQSLIDARQILASLRSASETSHFGELAEHLNWAARYRRMISTNGVQSLRFTDSYALNTDLGWDYVGDARRGTALNYWQDSRRGAKTQNLIALAALADQPDKPHATRSDIIRTHMKKAPETIRYAATHAIGLAGSGETQYYLNPYQTEAA